jgi:hypothetical protein
MRGRVGTLGSPTSPPIKGTPLSVGARVVWSGGVGLYGRPPSLARMETSIEEIYQEKSEISPIHQIFSPAKIIDNKRTRYPSQEPRPLVGIKWYSWSNTPSVYGLRTFRPGYQIQWGHRLLEVRWGLPYSPVAQSLGVLDS